MSVQPYEDSLDIQIGVVEATMPTPEAPLGYPRPRLTALPQMEVRTFAVWVLENPFLVVKVAPALGGRIVSLLDKRTGLDLVATPDVLLCREDTYGQVILPLGIHFRSQPQGNALGWVEAQPESTEGDGGTTLWLGDVEVGTGLSWHVAIHLPVDEARVHVESRVLNRTLSPVAYEPEWVVYGGGSQVRGPMIYDATRQTGCALWSEPWPEPITVEGDIARFQRLRGFLAPRQTDVWKAVLTPLYGMDLITEAAPFVAAGLSGQDLTIVSHRDMQGVKLILATLQGNQEATLDLGCSRPLRIPLPFVPSALALQDDRNERLLQWDPSETKASACPTFGSTPVLDDVVTEERLHQATFDVAHRVEANLRLAFLKFGDTSYQSAYSHLEEALLYNADDPLAWWAKAVAARLDGVESEDNVDLLNAHYLAPLEPALRSESFLSLSPMMTAEPSPLLAPFEDKPETFVEVACLLLEHHLNDQATRWIDEALRHSDLAILRYLQAYAYLTGSRMKVEAAHQVDMASKIPYGPPFPWRAVERKAITTLVAAFPNDAALARLASLLKIG